MLEVYVDADACPVKDEVYRVAGRYGLNVTLVCNKWMGVPDEPWIKLVVVGKGLDEADDWIAARVEKGDIAITADIPLAARCLDRGALVLGNTGHELGEESIGDTLATRDLMFELREAGEITGGGPAPFSRKDRSRFLQRLDEMVQRVKREGCQ